ILAELKKRRDELSAELAEVTAMIEAADGTKTGGAPAPSPFTILPMPYPFPTVAPQPAIVPWIAQGHGTHCACQACIGTVWCGTSSGNDWTITGTRTPSITTGCGTSFFLTHPIQVDTNKTAS